MNEEKNCAISNIMNILGGKWKLEILWQILNDEGIRFNQLKRNIPGVTNVALIRCLKSLAEHKFIKRIDKKTVPPHVEYYTTEKTQLLFPILSQLAELGKTISS
ncbi:MULTISPECIES: winged helix-turn-helix transcriptional regulator [Enterococcus]|uniref:HTH hxlR-type domain-containing protein n=2 Tax=Enterococcus TaxID=1350 RepID=A0AAQ3W6J8_9ENTE|nr:MULTISPECIES: helix-turn-helix domain-containing protein [Enterococcus]EOL44361.1 hypothetical protein UC7_02405 [Enterococcus caccae ATCC BAA-1240]EOT68523.1 hypothetical protein I580_00906 [Enterococcus caccae ATCC BAA-1240]OTN85068.1 hypothetical protein A5821_000997 [Enterococcus sp. 7F3_DIV0205]